MLGHGGPGRLHERCGQGGAYGVAAIVAELGELVRLWLLEGLRAGVVTEQRGGSLAVEPPDQSGELGEDEVDEAVDLADPIAEVLAESIVEVDEFTEVVEVGVGRRSGLGTLLGAEAGQTDSIGEVGLGPAKILLGEATSAEGIDDGDLEPASAQGREQVLPVMAGALQDNEGIVR